MCDYLLYFMFFGVMFSWNAAQQDTCTPPATCVCYDQVGCFSSSAPFNNALGNLPKSPRDIGVQAQLFTRRNWNDTYFVDFVNTSSIEGSNFNKSLQIKFVIHGFANTIQTEWLYQMKDELLIKDDFNVFVITWGPGAAFPAYDQAVANTRVVAKMVKLLITNLLAVGVNPGHIHLIGHSLGAHISGVVGSMLKNESLIIGRISGMDPAEPDFLNYRDVIRLSRDDASFVDVIHTDGQKFRTIAGFGLYIPSGHVDFYINGGLKQPDCKNPTSLFSGGLFSGGTDAITTTFSCSHSRSHEVFLESINSQCSFTAYPCESYEKFQAGDCLSCGEDGCSRMGYASDRYKATGKFYLNTRKSTPFCGTDHVLEIDNSFENVIARVTRANKRISSVPARPSHHYKVTVKLGSTANTAGGDLTVQLNGTWAVSEWLDVHLDVPQSTSDHLDAGRTVNRVVVAEHTVGYLQSIKVKFTAGSDVPLVIVVKTIEIESGESGLKYSYCLNSTLTSDTVLRLPQVSAGACSL